MTSNTSLILNHILWRGLYFFSVFLLNILIARFFAAEKSGHIFFIVNNLAFALLLVSISLESGAVYYISSGNLDAYAMARFCVVWAIVASGIAFALWWGVLFLTRSVYLNDTGFKWASVVFILGSLFTTYFTALFYAKKQFGLPNKILFILNCLLICILIGGKNNPAIRLHFIDLYFGFFFLQGLALVIFFFSQHHGISEYKLPSRQVLKKVLHYSLTALLANGIYFLVYRIDYWFVQYFCPAKDLGNYIQASKLGQMLLILPAILGSTLFPIFSSQNKSDNQYPLTASIRILLLINTGICVFIICTGWFIIPFVFGSSFSNMYFLFALLIPGILFTTMNSPLTAWFSANKKIGINIRGSLLALVLICIGDLIAIPLYGVPAASVMSSAGYFSYFAYMAYRYRKESEIPWTDFFVIRKSDIQRIRQSIATKRGTVASENYSVQNLIP